MFQTPETSNSTPSLHSIFPAPQADGLGSPGEAVRKALIGSTVADVERHLILDTLAYCHGNRTHAARILGISIRTLRNKLNEYAEAGIVIPQPGQKPQAID